MQYRIEVMPNNNKIMIGYNDYCDILTEVRDYIKNCVPFNYHVSRIVKTYNDGRAIDVTHRFIRKAK